LAGSAAMAGRRVRADGLVAGCCWVQVVPSQVQVSSRKLLVLLIPPKSTTLPVPGSVAIAGVCRAAGLVAGLRLVQHIDVWSGLAAVKQLPLEYAAPAELSTRAEASKPNEPRLAPHRRRRRRDSAACIRMGPSHDHAALRISA